MRTTARTGLILGAAALLLAGGATYYALTDKNEPAAAPAPQTASAGRTPAPDSPYAKYDRFEIIDAHNHDASKWMSSLKTWDKYRIARVVLFGAVSEPAAVADDANAWKAYQEHPNQFYPLFSGFDLHSKDSLDAVKKHLEDGYFGPGEIVASSEYSPVVSKVAWKGFNAMDGYLPQIYDLCAQYKAPILLHIDPANAEQMGKLEEALTKHPDTTMIYGHGNVASSPEKLDQLLAAHPNLVVDFLPGFSVQQHKLEAFLPVIKKYPERFVISTDSAYGMNYDDAYKAIYQTLDLLDPDIARKIAHDNISDLYEKEPITATQIKRLEELTKTMDINFNIPSLTKSDANEKIFQIEKMKE